jgi:hypothetical protein
MTGRYRVMRRHVGGLVDVAHPLRPGDLSCFMHGRSRCEVLANLRALGITGVELVEVGIGDRAMGAA